MNVQELIEILEQMDPTATVVLSSDPEGNKYAPLEDYSEGFYSTKYSEFYEEDEEMDVQMQDAGFEVMDDGSDEAKKTGLPAVVFWPAY